MTTEELAIAQRDFTRIRVLLPDGWSVDQRNRKAIQIYYWLNERTGGRECWCLERGIGATDYYVPHHLALMFKLSFGGL